MDSKSVYIPIDRCQAIVKGTDLPNRTYGAALFADISGFTPLTEALLKAYGPRRGPEELTRQLNRIFDALVAEVHRYGGSVIALNGDAITCWLDGDDGLRAIACGLAMQQSMDQFAALKIPTRGTVSLAMKAAVTTGSVRRFLVGDPQIQYIDVLAGATLDRMATAEHQAKKGEVVVGSEVMVHIGDQVELAEWRHEPETGERFGVVSRLLLQAPVQATPWPSFSPETLTEAQMRPWLLPPVYERLQAGKGEFLAELRPAVVLFLSFGGIDYDADESAGTKLDAYIRWVQNILARYEGYLLQLTVGDKGSYLYTAFGAPIAHEDDALRAVSAALELRNLPITLDFIENVQIGIGQGQIYTGAYGGTMRRTYGLMGDDVNLAARLMQAAAPGQVLISHTARQAIADAFTWESLPPLKVKGKAEPVTVFSLGEWKESHAIHLQEPKYALPMVGREAELALIEQKLTQALAGRGQIIGITAEAGMGKSRLVAEVIHKASTYHFVGYGGECQSYGTNISYLVWQPIWRGFFGLELAWSLSQQVSELERQLKHIDPVLVPRLPLLGAVLNLSIPDNELTHSFDAKLRKASLEALLVDCLRARAQETPLLIVLEDCHWLDPLSHDLLEEIARPMIDLPVLLVMTLRPPELPRLQAPRISQLVHFTEILLTDFTAQEAEQLITLKLQQFFGAQIKLSSSLVERVTARAQGNPFYIEELLNYLQDQGFDPNNSETLEQLDLPTSLHSLILSRIDRLSESQKSLVKVASVIGRLFRAAWLWGVYPELGDPPHIQADLDTLGRMELIPLDSQEPELIYLFKHVITQEVAYESLPYATRATLHEQLAWFIERVYSEILEQYVDLLAYHYERSQNEAKKREYLRKAGEAAQANYANEAAISYYQKVLTLWETDTDTAQMARPFEVYEGLGEMLVSQERYAEAIETFTTMRVAAEAAGETRMQARAWYGLSTVQRNQGDHRAVLESAIQVEAAARAAGANVELAMALLMKGRSLVILGDVEAALALGEQVLALTTEIGAQAQMARSLSLLGWVHGASGRYAQSDDCFARALAICEELDDRVQEMDLLNNLGVNAEARGDYRTAFARYQEALRIAQEIGYRDGALVFQNNLGMALVRMGEYQAAEIDLRQVIYRAETTGSGGLSDAYSFLAEACLGQGKVNEALSAARQALVLGQDNEDQLSIAAAWRALGKVASHLLTPIVIEDEHGGQLGVYEAAVCFAESIRICTETGMEGERARTLQAWATHELERGDRMQGEAMWQEARQLFAQLEADLEVERMAALPSSLIMTE